DQRRRARPSHGTSVPEPGCPALRIRASARGRAPVDRTGDQGVRAERPAEDALSLARGLEQAVEVDPRLDAHLVPHRDEVLGGEIAGRAGGHRAAAELAEARLEALAAALERGERVGQ